MQSSLEAVGINCEKVVDETEELHHPLILSEILVPFQDIMVVFTITSLHCETARPLFGRNDG